jgi:CO/xanthine dehydrogenase Mo-binding subunit
MDHATGDLADYIIATAADMPKEMVWDIVEVPHPNGPRGAKGFSEMTSSAAPPAILSAIHNATGVWITDYPATPERILRALETAEKK